jgi:putative ATPase
LYFCHMNKPPLAERLRPQSIDALVGQQHLTGSGSILRTAITNGKIPSMILWGPPGVGKTTIANVIANSVQSHFFTLSAIAAGVKEVREVIEKARLLDKVILFIDEIHRFNKGQQDALLGAVEKGTITLIGATTENPSFEVNSALLSRCQVFVLRALEQHEMISLLTNAIQKDEVLKNQQLVLKETDALINIAGGGARKLLNLLELVAETIHTGEITNENVMTIAQRKIALYDKKGEQHYDVISAFIKSIRGSDPNGALYWLARMIDAGEDVKFIARRLLILASEDIGNANPNALLLANAAFDAVNKIGWPESSLILSQCTIYLATSAKSNAATTAIGAALDAVKKQGNLPVPLHLRNAPTPLMKDLGYKKDYQYAHHFSNNFSVQEYLPDGLSGQKLFEPGNNARENEIRAQLKKWWGEKYGY